MSHRLVLVLYLLLTPLLAACSADAERGVGAPPSLASPHETVTPGDRVDIYVMDADGTKLERLTDDPLSSGTNIVWSPQGDRMLFSRGSPDKFGIFVMGSDGSDQEAVTPVEGINVAGSWLPDDTIIVSSDRWGTLRLYAMSLDGEDMEPLPNTQDGDYFPDVSPDGTTIAFLDSDGPESDIWKMRTDGSDRVPLAVAPFAQKWTSWSPDSKQLAYHDLRSETIRLADVDSGESRKLELDRPALMPDWSPDGRRIAFISNGDICIVTLAGMQDICFERKGEEFGPRWSPDGQQLAFAYVRG